MTDVHVSTRSPLLLATRDVLTVAQRNLIVLVRTPTTMVFTLVQPVMFVLLFRYVFGGAIQSVGTNYVNYLVPGILVQTALFSSISTTIGLAEDLQKGLIERFRALPMTRLAVMTGRTVSDLVRSVMVLIVIMLVGVAVGFRPDNGVGPFVGACALMLLFGYCLSWGFAFVGLAAPNAEAAQAMIFPIIFPIIFASSIFVPVKTMPSWLQGFATYQPVSRTATAVRGLMLGLPTGTAVWASLAWGVGIACVLAPLAINRYRKVA